MNIINFYQIKINNSKFNFKAKTPKVSVLKELTQDVVEISKPKRGRPKQIVPLKIELTSLEQIFLEINSKIINLYWKVSELERLIKDYPSEASINREEKQNVMKEIRKQQKMLNKIKEQIVQTNPKFQALSSNFNIEKIIKQKKMYNKYSEKISSAKTKNELDELINRITFVFENAKSNFQIDPKTKYDLNETQFKNLMKLIKQRKQEIKSSKG